MNPAARFFAKVVMPHWGDGCWIWTGAMRGNPASLYGCFWSGEKYVAAHRWSLEFFTGREIPDGLVVDHLCQARACVNPAHLDIVTIRENTMRAEGPSSINSRKTHCMRGHEFNERNTRVHAGGRKRMCIPCKVEYDGRRRVNR